MTIFVLLGIAVLAGVYLLMGSRPASTSLVLPRMSDDAFPDESPVTKTTHCTQQQAVAALLLLERYLRQRGSNNTANSLLQYSPEILRSDSEGGE